MADDCFGAMLQESGVPSTLRVGEVMGLFRAYYPTSLPAATILAAADLEPERGRGATWRTVALGRVPREALAHPGPQRTAPQSI